MDGQMNPRFFLILLILILAICGCKNSKTEQAEDISFSDIYRESFSDGSYLNWQANFPENWEVIDQDSQRALHLIRPGIFGKIRKPSSYNILKRLDVTDFELTVEAKCLADRSVEGRDVAIFFGFQDSIHFYYSHISNHNHKYHNIIGLVNGEDRVPIADPPNDDSLARLTGYNWHKIKVIRNSSSGGTKAFVDDMDIPIHSIVDTTLRHGHIGVGSFDDFGMFRNLTLKYNKWQD